LLDAVRDLRRVLGAARFEQVAAGRLADLRRLLPELDGPRSAGAPAALSAAQVQEATAGLLRDAAADQPLLLVLEDVHWSDQSSRDVLDHLVRSLRNERLGGVLTVRTDDPAYDSVSEFVAELGSLRRATRVELDRLGRDDVAAQVRGLDGAAETADLERVLEVSGGVPLLVEELVGSGASDLDQLADRLLGHRVRRLASEGRSVVDTAAVALVDIHLDDLAAVADLAPDEFDTGVAEAVSGGVLVRRAGSIAFRHALLREAATALLPHARATGLHRSWAERLGGRVRGLAEAVAVAQHWTAGDRVGPALRSWLRAADLAEQVSAYPEQMRMLREASDLWPRVPPEEQPPDTDLAAVLTAAAEAALRGLGRMEASQELITAARAALPPDAPAARRAWLAVMWDRSLWHRDDHLTWKEAVATAGDIPADPATPERAVTCLWAASVCRRGAHIAEAHAFATEAVEVARAIGDVELRIHAMAELSHVESALGQDAAAVTTAEEAARLADQSRDLFARETALQTLSLVLWIAGRDPESQQVTERLVDLLGGDEPGMMPASWGMATTNLAEGLLDLGRWDEAHTVLERVFAEPDLPDYVFWSGVRLRDHLAHWRGWPQPDRTGWPTSPRRHTVEDTDVDDLLPTRYTYIDIYARADLEEIGEMVHSVLEDDRITTNTASLYPLLSVVARREADLAGDGDPAPDEGAWVASRIEHLLALAPPRNDRDRAWEATIRADLARRVGRDTPEVWSCAAAAWRKVVRPHELGWTLMRSGQQEAAAGRPTEARRALAEALDIGERLGAAPLVDAVLAAGRQARLRLTTATAPAATLGLTERELDVLRLLADGLPNAAIGHRLFISPKTVSVHVSHILDKLGVANRGEAAAAAHRHGLMAD
jgi:DNA-binding CsgD family transcriptional regulator/tetratricopeptide (TPR) repeat protein